MSLRFNDSCFTQGVKVKKAADKDRHPMSFSGHLNPSLQHIMTVDIHCTIKTQNVITKFTDVEH